MEWVGWLRTRWIPADRTGTWTEVLSAPLCTAPRVHRRRTALRGRLLRQWVRPSGIAPQVLIVRAAEPRVDVLIVGLKPIAETRAQHAGGGPHAAAFQNVVPGIEERG